MEKEPFELTVQTSYIHHAKYVLGEIFKQTFSVITKFFVTWQNSNCFIENAFLFLFTNSANIKLKYASSSFFKGQEILINLSCNC